jgi:hypothetical protein
VADDPVVNALTSCEPELKRLVPEAIASRECDRFARPARPLNARQCRLQPSDRAAVRGQVRFCSVIVCGRSASTWSSAILVAISGRGVRAGCTRSRLVLGLLGRTGCCGVTGLNLLVKHRQIASWDIGRLRESCDVVAREDAQLAVGGPQVGGVAHAATGSMRSPV